MSGVYMLFHCVLVVTKYLELTQIGWLLWLVMFLSLSILILIVQPYKKNYMNVLDGLLLALMGFVMLLKGRIFDQCLESICSFELKLSLSFTMLQIK